MASTESESATLRWLALVFSAATLFVAWPLWPALVLAAWTAGLTHPLLVRLEPVLRGRRRAAAVLALLLFLLLLVPLSLLALGVGAGAQDLVQAIARANSAKGALADIAAGGAAPTEAVQLPSNLAEALELLERYGTQAYSVTSQLVGVAASGLVALFIYFAGAFALLVDGNRGWRWVRRNAPVRNDQLDRLGAAFHETGRGLIIGVGLTSVTQGLAATLAYLALGVPRAWVLGPITGVASVVPIAGTALVWGPISVGLFLAGHTVKAVILLVIGVAVIGSIDNLVRPLYSRLGTLKMPTFLLFVSMFGGLSAFGTWGAILGPLLVRLTMEILSIRKDAELEASSDARDAVMRSRYPARFERKKRKRWR